MQEPASGRGPEGRATEGASTYRFSAASHPPSLRRAPASCFACSASEVVGSQPANLVSKGELLALGKQANARWPSGLPRPENSRP